MPTQSAPARRVSTDETVTDLPEDPQPTDEVLTAEIPGADPAKFVTLTLSHPLNKSDRQRLGLPVDGSTEVGQKVAVSKNGAKAIVSAGYATVDPEDGEAVARVMQGAQAEDPTDTSTGGPSVEPAQGAATPSGTKAGDSTTAGVAGAAATGTGSGASTASSTS